MDADMADGAISKVLNDLNIDFQLKEEQLRTIKAIINREDVFAVLPTGYGKSHIYDGSFGIGRGKRTIY